MLNFIKHQGHGISSTSELKLALNYRHCVKKQRKHVPSPLFGVQHHPMLP